MQVLMQNFSQKSMPINRIGYKGYVAEDEMAKLVSKMFKQRTYEGIKALEEALSNSNLGKHGQETLKTYQKKLTPQTSLTEMAESLIQIAREHCFHSEPVQKLARNLEISSNLRVKKVRTENPLNKIKYN